MYTMFILRNSSPKRGLLIIKQDNLPSVFGSIFKFNNELSKMLIFETFKYTKKPYF